MFKRIARDWIRTHSDGPLVRTLARRCEGFLYLAYNQGFWDFDRNGEARVLRTIGAHLKGQIPIVLDVGAHYGEWCASCTAIMPDARVYSFELIAEQAAEARAQHASNPNVSVFEFGLSDSDAEIEISYNPAAGRATSIAPRLRSQFFADVPLRKALCQVRRGDQVAELNALPRIDLLKIDTEGHELFVLRGLEGVLANPQLRPTVIQFEYGDTFIPQRATLSEVHGLLAPLGYAIGRVSPRGVNFKPYSYADEHYRMGNYVAVQGAPDLQRALQGAWAGA
ncbi:FkbM family methyltransferase [Sandarakinorhabdus rubra]|uniref:FkbM family methyltransferase n=1 Tax=Sandarakinorhabdus rubra TaxID=2672568 RepID=UPI0013D93983|nr:FkbM family methyltransferase [Sandarakinorhabdus rubra]